MNDQQPKFSSIDTCYDMMELYGPSIVLRYKLFTSHWMIRVIIQPILFIFICYRQINGCEAMMGDLMNISTRYCTDKSSLVYQLLNYMNHDSQALYQIYHDINDENIIHIDYSYSELIYQIFGRHFIWSVVTLFVIFYAYTCFILFVYDPLNILYNKNDEL